MDSAPGAGSVDDPKFLGCVTGAPRVDVSVFGRGVSSRGTQTAKEKLNGSSPGVHSRLKSSPARALTPRCLRRRNATGPATRAFVCCCEPVVASCWYPRDGSKVPWPFSSTTSRPFASSSRSLRALRRRHESEGGGRSQGAAASRRARVESIARAIDGSE
jgi:hypothetical protein